jgi:hypothetical protein
MKSAADLVFKLSRFLFVSYLRARKAGYAKVKNKRKNKKKERERNKNSGFSEKGKITLKIFCVKSSKQVKNS